MIARGIPADQIDNYLAAKRKTGGSEKRLEVLEENWNSVEVYRRCTWEIEMGPMGGVVYKGIRAVEIEAVARGVKVEFDADLIDCIRVMEGAAAKVYNARDK